MNFRTRMSDAILLLFALLAIAYPVAGFDLLQKPETKVADLTFAGPNFEGAETQGVMAQAEGLQLQDPSMTSTYTSLVIEAPIPFNVLFPQWIADVPAGAGMSIAVRTGTENGRWSDWYPVEENHDWTRPEDPDVVGTMITVSAEDITHRYLQYSIGFSRYDGQATPLLKELHFTFIDSTAGPTMEEMVAQQQALDASQAQTFAAEGVAPNKFAKPAVISRQVWCTDPDCNYSDGLAYEPVTHLILHHTVSSNSSSDWPAVVRAIWKFHTYSRGWGDIGYNYLADRNGVIYEGHLGGDDVIGTHASAANRGSMALSLIGTFTLPDDSPPGIQPPQPMLEAAANLFAWKADQKGINVYDAGRLPNMTWGLPKLMGHRDVYGGTNTECPGEQAYRLLPWLRDAVAQRLGYQSPYVYIDETSSNFKRSNNSWHEGPAGCGNNGHSFYTWSVTDPNASTNWGEWTLAVPVEGVYEIEVYAPYCTTGRSETDGARYTVTHANGSSNVTISHNDKVGLWMSLGEFPLRADGSSKLRLTDLTSTDEGRGVWFDAVRLRLVGGSVPQTPTITTQQPTADLWLTNRTVAFNWLVGNGGSVERTWLQVATDSGFTNLVLDLNWAGLVQSYTQTFTQDFGELYWRVVVKTATTQIVAPPSKFAIDATGPVTAVHGYYILGWNGQQVVAWSGQDNLSGIANYKVEYRAAGDANWTTWLANTAATTATFTPPNPALVYEFRSQGIDHLGNAETAHAAADFNTLQAKPLPHAIMMPVIMR